MMIFEEPGEAERFAKRLDKANRMLKKLKRSIQDVYKSLINVLILAQTAGNIS